MMLMGNDMVFKIVLTLIFLAAIHLTNIYVDNIDPLA
jgi:hypothetical protein